MHVRTAVAISLMAGIAVLSSGGSVKAAPLAANKIYHGATYTVRYPSSWEVVKGAHDAVVFVTPSQGALIDISSKKVKGKVTPAALRRGLSATLTKLNGKRFNGRYSQMTIGGALFLTAAVDTTTSLGFTKARIYIGSHKSYAYAIIGEVFVKGAAQAADDEAVERRIVSTLTFS